MKQILLVSTKCMMLYDVIYPKMMINDADDHKLYDN